MQCPSKTSPRLLSVNETAAYTKMSKSWLDKQRLLGRFVPYVKIGRRVFYDIVCLKDLNSEFSRAMYKLSERLPDIIERLSA
jgi:hypothetical protein